MPSQPWPVPGKPCRLTSNPGTNPPVGGGATAALNLANVYNKASLFFDFGLGNGGSGPLPADRVYYFDDLSFVN